MIKKEFTMGSGASEGLAMSHVLTLEIIYILYDSTLNCIYVLFQICITFYNKNKLLQLKKKNKQAYEVFVTNNKVDE